MTTAAPARDFARERIAAANHNDAAANGRPTAHCLECGFLECECRPTDLDACPVCSGSGEVAVGFDWRDPAAGYTTTCPGCAGTGDVAA